MDAISNKLTLHLSEIWVFFLQYFLTQLAVISLGLFYTLLDLNCEDIMYSLVLKWVMFEKKKRYIYRERWHPNLGKTPNPMKPWWGPREFNLWQDPQLSLVSPTLTKTGSWDYRHRHPNPRKLTVFPACTSLPILSDPTNILTRANLANIPTTTLSRPSKSLWPLRTSYVFHNS